MFALDKFSLIITTRCNLRCKLCCEDVPQNKPFPDMTPSEARRLLEAVFDVCDHIGRLHLTGGGEPFLHPRLAELIDLALEYTGKFDRLMLFSNALAPLGADLLETLGRHREKLFVQLSRYGINPRREAAFGEALEGAGIACRTLTYYGEKQSFGGWVSFGDWLAQEKTPEELADRFARCAVTRDLRGNWRTRDGKVHWCSRSQRGMELGHIPDISDDYVDLLDETTREEKRAKFESIANKRFLSACDRCSGDQGTDDAALRFPAGQQE